jgi:hypothetical protein
MKKNAFLRRSGVVLTTAGVTAALTLGLPLAANAAVHAQFAAAASANADYTGPTIGGTCLLSSGDDGTESSIATFTHGTKHRSVNLDATFASSDNAADTVRVRGHLNTDLTIRKQGKDLKSFDFAAGGSVKINHALSGSSCAGSGTVIGEMAIEFTEHHKGYFYLTRTTKKPGSIAVFALVNLENGKLVTLDLFQGTRSKSTSRALLKPGHYGVELSEIGISAGTGGIILKSPEARSAKVARTIHLLAEFKRKS